MKETKESMAELLRNGHTLPSWEDDRDKAPPAKQKNSKATTKGRFHTLNSFVDYSARLVDTTAQAVWFVLFRETKPDGTARISQGQIGEVLGVSRRTARRAINSLSDAGLIEIVRRAKCGGDHSVYRVHGTPNRQL